ncbi:hypothetical protein PVL29_017938 [Vitis rotundifolia]|uniref:GATA-type domain-containing protein n=1 Tax=Vitis rotundifolia TaxID=103349 RepID=A0AA39DGY4_VITRO|nr:hypothetical protein PVL29_017938 [Vitis rotundifolia]
MIIIVCVVVQESLSEEMNEIKKCCTDCKTTKTPLWRGGPAGPKSLCNACGIRYRKRRSSMVGVNKKKERMNSGSHDLSETLKKSLMALGNEVMMQRQRSSVKKQRRKLGEEEQAAVLLMALSCGSVFA